MKNARPQTTEASALDKRHFTTDNPRHLRALAALLRRPMPRKSLDHAAGCSNGPELVAELRRRGLDAPCERIKFIDRDGKLCRPGVYHLTNSDRKKISRWLATRQRGGIDASLVGWLAFAGLCAALLLGLL